MTTILGLAGFVLNVSSYFKRIEEKKQEDLMDELAPNEEIDLVKVREQLEYLQETLNREMPVNESIASTTFKTFIAEAGVTDNLDVLILKIKNVVLESKDIIQQMNELKEWDSIQEIIKNAKAIIGVIGKIINAVIVAIVAEAVDEIGKYTDEEIAEAVSVYLDYFFKFNPIIEVFDKKIFKSIAYVAIVLVHQLLDGIETPVDVIVTVENPVI